MAERSPSSLNGPPSRKLSSLAHTEYEDSADKPSSSLRSDRSVSLLDNRDAKVKKASPSDDAILKESLQVHNSSKTCVTTATTQLKVLCRKFAVLSEKVKQEAKMREDAEKEIRRLNDIIQDATNPLITSTRTDAQQYLRAQKDELADVRDQLHRTQDELYHVTQAYDRLRAELEHHHHASLQPPSHPLQQHQGMVDHQIQWDREQASRIQDTLSSTITELHDELNVKEVEIESLRASLQREKTKQREMEQTTVAYEEQNRQDKDQLTKVTQHLRDVTMSHANELEKLHAAQESAKEERTVKEALQHQISTLHQVNDALQKRCDALVRRLQLNSNCMSESQGLKSQLEELEAQHEILAKAMRDAKQSHYQDMEALKAALYESQSAAHEAEKRALELQGELTAVRVQNNTMSEYMMYGPKRVQPIAAIGSDNHSHQSSPRISPTYGRQQAPQPPPPPPLPSSLHYHTPPLPRFHPHSIHQPTSQLPHQGALLTSTPAQPPHSSPHYSSTYHNPNGHPQLPRRQGYVDHPTRAGSDPTIRAAPPAGTLYSDETYRPELERRPVVGGKPYEPESEQPKTVIHISSTPHQPPPPSAASTTPIAARTTPPPLQCRTSSTSSTTNSRQSNASSNGSDHSILRALKNRNKQLQERLQQEADATFQLEEEINMITSSYHTLLNPHD